MTFSLVKPSPTIGETSDHVPYVECSWASAVNLVNTMMGNMVPATPAEREALRVAGGGSDDATGLHGTLPMVINGIHNRYGHSLIQGAQTWEAIDGDIVDGHWLIVQGMYGALPAHFKRFQPGGNFAHATCVGPGNDVSAWWIDPLGPDGYGGELIPLSALKAFCAGLAFRNLPARAPWASMNYVHSVAVTAVPNLRIRQSPSTSAPIVGSLPTGARVVTSQILQAQGAYIGPDGKTHNDWLGYILGGHTVYIARAYTKFLS